MPTERDLASPSSAPADHPDPPPAAAVAPCDRFVRINGLRLHFLEWGEPGQPALVLLHGGSAHAHWWDFFAQALGPGFRIVALDLRGHGDSEWADPSCYDLEHHAADVDALLSALDLNGATLIGHSFGGMVSIHFARSNPARLDRLVIVDTRARITERGSRFMRAMRRLPHTVYSTREEAIRSFRVLPEQTNASPQALLHLAQHAFRQREDGGWVLKFDRRGMGDTHRRDLSLDVGGIDRPVLFVRGGLSDFIPRELAASLVASARHARLVEIPGAHHHVMLDQPVLLARAVREFLPAPVRSDTCRLPLRRD